MRKIKWISFFLVMLFLLSGCDQEDIERYEQYTNLIGDGKTCTYYPYSSSAYSDIEEIEISALPDKITITYVVDGIKYPIDFLTINRAQADFSLNENHSFAGFDLSYNDFSYINYLNYFETANGCPDSIYIDPNGGRVLETKYEEDYVTFSTGSSSPIESDSINPNAVDYRQYTIDTYLDGEVTVEVGLENYRSNGEELTGKYFAVSSDEGHGIGHNYNNNTDSSPVQVGSYQYIVRAVDWNLLVPDNGSFPDAIILDEIDMAGVEVANVTIEGSQTLEDYSNFTDIEDIYPERNPSGNGQFDPDKLCENGNCDISLDNFCGEPTVARTLKFVGLLLFIAKILVPAIIIIMGFVNLFKIITSGKEDDAKKYAKTIVRNIVIGVVIFLAPTIIQMVFDAADDIISPDERSDFANCVNCILDPNDESACIIRESD